MQSQSPGLRQSGPVPAPLAAGDGFQLLLRFGGHGGRLQLFCLALDGTGGDLLPLTVHIVLVPFQIGRLGKRLGARATDKRLFPSVSSFMIFEVGLVFEGFVTHVARKRSLVTVHSLVLFQVRGADKGFPTHLTAVGLIACVDF